MAKELNTCLDCVVNNVRDCSHCENSLGSPSIATLFHLFEIQMFQLEWENEVCRAIAQLNILVLNYTDTGIVLKEMTLLDATKRFVRDQKRCVNGYLKSYLLG